MNKKLFGTKSYAEREKELENSFVQYAEETAINLVAADPDNQDEAVFLSRALQEIAWSSWAVGLRPRQTAYIVSSAAMLLKTKDKKYDWKVNHRPTKDEAVQVISEYIASKCMEIAGRSIPRNYKLRFKTMNRFLLVSDLNPVSDMETEWSSGGYYLRRDEVKQKVKDFYASYKSLGVEPPVIEMVGFDDSNNIIETLTIKVDEE